MGFHEYNIENTERRMSYAKHLRNACKKSENKTGG